MSMGIWIMIAFGAVFVCMGLCNAIVYVIGDRRKNYVRSPTGENVDNDAYAAAADGTAGGAEQEPELKYKDDPELANVEPDKREPKRVMAQFQISKETHAQMVAMVKQESLSLGFDHDDRDLR